MNPLPTLSDFEYRVLVQQIGSERWEVVAGPIQSGVRADDIFRDMARLNDNRPGSVRLDRRPIGSWEEVRFS